MHRFSAVRSSLFGLSLLFAVSSSATAGVVIVKATGLQFQPKNIVIQMGDTVRWERNDFMVHSVTEGTDGAINGNEAFHGWITPTIDSFEWVFDAAFVAANPRPNNLYNYFCEPHFLAGMKGTVRVLPAPGTAYCFGDGTGGPCPCGNVGANGSGCTNSTGVGALLTATGSSSVAAGDLVLHGSNAVPNSAGLYFQGNTLANGGNGNLFGAGLLCAATAINRLQVRFADAQGNSQSTINIAVAGSASPGTTRTYQLWYRDASGGPCGALFNTSNAYQIVWQ